MSKYLTALLGMAASLFLVTTLSMAANKADPEFEKLAAQLSPKELNSVIESFAQDIKALDENPVQSIQKVGEKTGRVTVANR